MIIKTIKRVQVQANRDTNEVLGEFIGPRLPRVPLSFVRISINAGRGEDFQRHFNGLADSFHPACRRVRTAARFYARANQIIRF